MSSHTTAGPGTATARETADAGPRIAVSGAGGFLGAALIRALRAEGAVPVPLVRRRPAHGEIGWDPRAGRLDPQALQEIDGVVHLAGESLNRRWTAARKQRIRESRAHGTRVLAEAIASCPQPPHVLVSASAIGYYGDRGDEILSEDSPPGDDFLSGVCQAWEAATSAATEAGVRVVLTRFAPILHPSGGALARMLPAFRLGLGARLGHGRQWMSWISLPDAVRVVRYSLQEKELRGAVNATAPVPVRNADFAHALGRALRRPAALALPAAALRLAFGELADAMLLASQRVVPARLLALGFAFEHADLEVALREGLDGSQPRPQT